MHDGAGGTSLAVGLGVLGGVQIVNIGLAVELGIIAALGGLGGLVRCLLFGDYGHWLVHTAAVVAATTGVVMSFALPVGYLPWLHA
ncbi:hypothetical protein [Streptomyces sp. NPDC026673]|uniref:hypothetical protein n=1 Tax=Streptomyces sp. NPDC026673 TaxID=3155724 RepID=UPI0033F11B8E